MLLKELIENKMISLGRGQIISKDEINQFPGDYPVYSSSASETGEFGRYGKYMFDDERITWSIDGGGKMFYRNNHKYSVTNVCGWLKVDTPKLLAKYVYYCLFYQWSFRQFDYQYKAHPSVIKEIYDIPIIDVAKQKVIIETLDKVHEQISNEKEFIPFLDSLIKSRFNEMFTEAFFEIKPLDSITTKITDGSHNPPKGIHLSQYIMASSQNIKDELDLSSVRYLTKEDFDRENKRTNIETGDLLFTIVGTIGRSYVVKNEKLVFQRSVAVIKPIKNIIDSIYLKHYLDSIDGMSQIEKASHGVAQMGIYLSDLKKITIKIPPIEKQLEFKNFVNHIDKLKFNCQQRIKLYQELLDKKMDEYFG